MGGAIELTSSQRTMIFINISITAFSGTMLGTALTTAIPQLMKDFDISVNTAQWLTSGYTLLMSIFMPMTSFLINRYKTKPLYRSALIIFLVGLLLCIGGVNFPMVLTGRLIQSIGGGLTSALAQVIILTIYPPEKRGYAMGWYGLSLNVAPIISPTISGLLMDIAGWRMIFVLPLVFIVLSLICSIFFFENVLPNRPVHLDFFSLILSAFTFGGIILAVGNFGSYKFVSYQVLMILIIGIVAGVIFTWRQLHMTSPFLDIRVFKHRDFTLGVLTTFIVQMILNGSAVILPYYFQEVKDKSATISGLAILPGSLALSFISPYAGKLYDKMGIQQLFIFAGVVSTASNFGLYFLKTGADIWVVIVVHIARCLALGVITMPAITWSMSRIPEDKTADGAATQNTFRIVSMSIGAALFVSIMTSVSENVSKSPKEAELYGINVVFLCMAVLSAIFLIFSFFAKENNKEKEKKRANKKEKDIKKPTEEEEEEKERDDITVYSIDEGKDITEVNDNNKEVASKEIEIIIENDDHKNSIKEKNNN